MSNDAELLRSYTRDCSEKAFSEFVQRHVNLVYSASLRHANGDTALAEDITQSVFTEVARKASRLSRHPALAGWLYTCVHHVAANLRRSEQRRRKREQVACAMNDLQSPDVDDGLWQQVRPVLDEAMHELSAKDRTAVVLRFFEERSLREVGEALGLNENSARMRVERALEKLRGLLARRGGISTIPSLTAVLGAGAVLGAPPGLAATVSAGALAQVGVGTATPTLVLWQIMNATKVKIGLAAVLVTAGVSVPVWQQTQVKRFRAENETLQAQMEDLHSLRADVERSRGTTADLAELGRLRNSEQQQQQEIAKLRNRLAKMLAADASERAATPIHPAQSGSASNVMSAGMSAAVNRAMERALQQQTLAKIPRLKATLNLSPEQEDAVRQILTKKMERAREMAQKTMAGTVTREDLERKRQMSPNAEEQIKALLSPEQLAAYEDYEQQESRARARLVANAELLRMQDTLGLSEEQQDTVFTALYDHTVARMNGEFNDTRPETGDKLANELWVMEERVKALEPVLTPEQLEQYRRIQEDLAKLTTSLFQPKDGPTEP